MLGVHLVHIFKIKQFLYYNNIFKRKYIKNVNNFPIIKYLQIFANFTLSLKVVQNNICHFAHIKLQYIEINIFKDILQASSKTQKRKFPNFSLNYSYSYSYSFYFPSLISQSELLFTLSPRSYLKSNILITLCLH